MNNKQKPYYTLKLFNKKFFKHQVVYYLNVIETFKGYFYFVPGLVNKSNLVINVLISSKKFVKKFSFLR